MRQKGKVITLKQYFYKAVNNKLVTIIIPAIYIII